MNRQAIIDLTTRIFVDYVDLVVLIEQEFGVKLIEADFKPIVTFNDFYTTLENKVNAR